jgi:DNA-binding response OmpR family regulator
VSDRQVKVLVVDDESDIRTIVGLNLGLAGMDFGEARNGDEALEMLREGAWDACVLDLMMPKSDGFTALEKLGAEGLLKEMAVVVLSAKGSPASAIRALHMGAHAHLTKPFSPVAVARIVEELVSQGPEKRELGRQSALERAGDLERLGVPTV